MPQDYQRGLKNEQSCGVYINRNVCRDMCVVVGYWAFGTMAGQDKSIQDKLDEDIDDDFEVGDLL